MNWFLFWLLLHIAAAVLGFGPAFAFPFIGFSAERQPENWPFAAGLMYLIHKRMIMPVGGTMIISGIGLIISGHINLFQTPWLLAGLLLYLVLMGLALGHQGPTNLRAITQMREAAAAGSPRPASAEALMEREKRVGMVMLLMLLVIVFLMIVHPGGTTYS